MACIYKFVLKVYCRVQRREFYTENGNLNTYHIIIISLAFYAIVVTAIKTTYTCASSLLNELENFEKRVGKITRKINRK